MDVKVGDMRESGVNLNGRTLKRIGYNSGVKRFTNDALGESGSSLKSFLHKVLTKIVDKGVTEVTGRDVEDALKQMPVNIVKKRDIKIDMNESLADIVESLSQREDTIS